MILYNHILVRLKLESNVSKVWLCQIYVHLHFVVKAHGSDYFLSIIAVQNKKVISWKILFVWFQTKSTRQELSKVNEFVHKKIEAARENFDKNNASCLIDLYLSQDASTDPEKHVTGNKCQKMEFAHHYVSKVKVTLVFRWSQKKFPNFYFRKSVEFQESYT